ncbi:MAG TPA: YdcF family protein [Candidatus Acidoferrum sp.]|nr:YdcF family protein [Candidatus Acidoferrum sp.]
MARRFSFRIAALIVLIGLCAAGLAAFRRVGWWLIREDPLAPADVIVVLSGNMPWRAEEAARLYRLGEACEVWVSQPVAPAAELNSMNIRYLGEDYFNSQVLIHSGVPEAAVHVLPDPIVDTQEEVAEISAKLRRDGKSSVIIVTSPQHTRRVKTLWRKMVGANPRAIVRAAPQDPFDAGHWWRTTQDTFSVARELMGLTNAWLGFPVRPHSQ